MSEDPLAASKSFAIQHSLANMEQMQKDIADSKNVLTQTENTFTRCFEIFNKSRPINSTSIKWDK